MGFFGLDRILNQATKPLGVRLFKGTGPGDYADNGFGDRQLGMVPEMQRIGGKYESYSDQLMGGGSARHVRMGPAASGINFDRGGATAIELQKQAEDAYANAVAAGVQVPEGFMQHFQKLISNMASTTGNVDPFSGESQGDPYAMNDVTSRQMNRKQALTNAQRERAISNARAYMAQRGIKGGPQLDRVLERINLQYDNELSSNADEYAEEVRGMRERGGQNIANMMLSGGQFQENQYQNRLNARGNVANMYGNRVNQGVNLLGGAMGATTGQAGLYGQAGDRAIQMNNNAMGNLGGVLGLGASGQLFPGLFTPKKRTKPGFNYGPT